MLSCEENIEEAIMTTVKEMIKSLTINQKQEALEALIREGMENLGDEMIMPIETANGEPFGYYTPPSLVDHQLEKIYTLFTAEEIRQKQQESDFLDSTIDLSEYFKTRCNESQNNMTNPIVCN
jgi:hypothetical protein